MNDAKQDEQPTTPTPGSGANVIYWLLIIMAVAAFAPCILLPEWRHYQALRLVEQSEQHRVDQFRGHYVKDRRLLEAMNSDPAVITRLAQRDLRFHRVDEKSVPISLDAPSSATSEKFFIPEPVAPPSWIGSLTARLPAYDYDQIFCDPKTSSIIMAMSVTLLAIAVTVVARRPANQSL